MARKTVSQKRAKLLAHLENIVGNQCFNGNIQNWGPNGIFEGEGREFRYPVTFVDKNGNKIKRRTSGSDLSPEILINGYYAFGANELHIAKALDEVLKYLEREHGLKL